MHPSSILIHACAHIGHSGIETTVNVMKWQVFKNAARLPKVYKTFLHNISPSDSGIKCIWLSTLSKPPPLYYHVSKLSGAGMNRF